MGTFRDTWIRLWKDFGKGIVIMVAVLALIGGIWAFDTRYVIRELFEIAQASDVTAREAIQVQFMQSGALDRLFYWQRMLMDLKVRREQNPNDKCTQEGIIEAQKHIDVIQEELKELQMLK